MRTGWTIFLSVLVLTGSLLPGLGPCAARAVEAGGENADGVWMYAMSVGKADAILLSAGGHTALIDTGYATSRGRVQAGLKQMGITRLDAVFVTHLDKDHIGGLTWLAESDLEIGAWYASAMYMNVESPKEHPMARAAALRGESVTFLAAGDTVPLGDAVLRVLAPIVLADDKDDNNSLVLMLESSEGRILLTGDIEFSAESRLMMSGADLKCDVLKVANHADNDTNSPAFTSRTSPQIAVISTSSEEKPDTPSPAVVRRLQNQGAAVYVTQDCTGGVLVRLQGGTATAELINLPVSTASVVLTAALPGRDLITLRNDGQEDVDLTDWYIVSSRGKESFWFPAGTVLPAGKTLTLGTRTSEEPYDLYWDDKKVVHAKKEDVFTLYDAYGSVVSQITNGL